MNLRGRRPEHEQQGLRLGRISEGLWVPPPRSSGSAGPAWRRPLCRRAPVHAQSLWQAGCLPGHCGVAGSPAGRILLTSSRMDRSRLGSTRKVRLCLPVRSWAVMYLPSTPTSTYSQVLRRPPPGRPEAACLWVQTPAGLASRAHSTGLSPHPLPPCNFLSTADT